jgi:SET domain-containing protein
MLHSALHPGFSRIHGMGVVALRDVPAGTALWWPCPRCAVVPPGHLADTPSDVLRWISEYGYRRTDGGLITPCGGAFLFNHSCDASVLDVGLAVGVAIRDIRQGEEVTCDYRGFRYEDPWRFRCTCGSARCVGTVESTQGTLDATLACRWTEQLDAALAVATSVPQETAVLSGDIHGEPVGQGDEG